MDTLRVARIKNGWSQEDLARVCGVTNMTISNIERGKTIPQEITRKRIESILGPIDWRKTEDMAIIISNGVYHAES
ncbi:helix-turn-helix domain-containing protein [Rhodohalobacter mucosus]|uniref:HTH cro/C1-type domain-containing protein n=1 Tax=Rhodohalobacter mucosus TaxID=2079485 RepID=A0A316TM29_9BACT|nr:helix-turn-helix transcriptional regulator [Rhodohalobacter mucosus]PWN05643.1 hypothetical protein DDZ15_13680 [Rhodohalobacter mucosus]